MDVPRILADHRLVVDEVGTRLLEPCLRAADLVCASLRAGGKLLLCGNGGSAADAQHIAAERPPYRL